MDLAALLAPVAEAHGQLLGELNQFQPSTLLAPLEQTLETALGAIGNALPVGDLADGLTAVLDRIRGVTGTLDAALDVAEPPSVGRSSSRWMRKKHHT
jgi:hypothetical protein